MKHTGEHSSATTVSRKAFLLAGVPALTTLAWSRCLAASGDTNEPPRRETREKTKTEAFAERVIVDLGRTYALVLGYLGDRLGLFKTMAAHGPLTAARLA